MHAPLILYVILFVATVIAPLRWSIISFLLLSNIDLGSLSASIGLLNTAKAMVLPVYLLWRFRAYAGHERIRSAPVAWLLLTLYVAIASGVAPWFTGLIMASNSHARQLSPNAANAIAVQIAAWVYCPPFSLTPGTYPLI